MHGIEAWQLWLILVGPPVVLIVCVALVIWGACRSWKKWRNRPRQPPYF